MDDPVPGHSLRPRERIQRVDHVLRLHRRAQLDTSINGLFARDEQFFDRFELRIFRCCELTFS